MLIELLILNKCFFYTEVTVQSKKMYIVIHKTFEKWYSESSN